MNIETMQALVRLNAAHGDYPERAWTIWSTLGPEVWTDQGRNWGQILGFIIEAQAVESRRAKAAAFAAEREVEAILAGGLRLIVRGEPDYPQLLASLPDAPLILYLRGTLDCARYALAFVGSRRPTPYGRRMARLLATQSAQAGLICVSGLARGIDTEAHLAALEAGGPTWAVLGSGLCRCYPPENEALATRIAAEGGCIISELPLETPPWAANFPRRNRIVSGLSWGTIVVEGEDHSGSLITARLAGAQGRAVFAVPGPADSPLSAAPHRLIRQGAVLAASMEDVWDELPPGARPAAPAREEQRKLAPDWRKILECLGPDVRTVEDLGHQTGIDMPRLSTILFEMEMQNLVGPVPGQGYAKKDK